MGGHALQPLPGAVAAGVLAATGLEGTEDVVGVHIVHKVVGPPDDALLPAGASRAVKCSTSTAAMGRGLVRRRSYHTY